MKKFLIAIANAFMFVFTGKGPDADECIKAGAISYHGQGRNEFGK